MHMKPIRAAAHKACRAGVLLAGISLLAVAQTALAQSTPPAAPATAEQAPSEAARRAALSPYRFILLNANAPARKPAPAPAPAPEAKRASAPVEQTALAARPAPAPNAPRAAAEVAPAVPVQATPEPAVASLSTKPPEPVPVRAARREIIPISTDEPRLTPALLREGASGTVRVQFDVNPDGSTGDVKVVSSSKRSLNRPSIEAVAGWKFQPVDEVLTVETELVYKLE